MGWRLPCITFGMLLTGCSFESLSEFSAGHGADEPPDRADPLARQGSIDGGIADGALPETDGARPGTTTGGGGTACTAALKQATFDFESGDQGWTHAVSDGAETQTSWPFDPWSRGTATTIACPDGACWAAERNQNYAQCGRGELISPKIDLSACAGQEVSLIFTHAYAFWSGSFSGQTWYDGGIVEISNDGGATWTVPSGAYPGSVKILGARSGYDCVLPNAFHVHDKSGFTGTQPSPVTVHLDVPAAFLTANVRIRFSQASGVSTATFGYARDGTAAGWRIDDVHFELP